MRIYKEDNMGFSLDMPDEAAIKEQVKAELAPLPERKEAIASFCN